MGSRFTFVSSGLVLPTVFFMLCTVFHISKTKGYYADIRFSEDVIMVH
jgi:hypothetical protein